MKRFRETSADYLVRYRSSADGVESDDWVHFSKEDFSLADIIENLAQSIVDLDKEDMKKYRLLQRLNKQLRSYESE